MFSTSLISQTPASRNSSFGEPGTPISIEGEPGDSPLCEELFVEEYEVNADFLQVLNSMKSSQAETATKSVDTDAFSEGEHAYNLGKNEVENPVKDRFTNGPFVPLMFQTERTVPVQESVSSESLTEIHLSDTLRNGKPGMTSFAESQDHRGVSESANFDHYLHPIVQRSIQLNVQQEFRLKTGLNSTLNSAFETGSTDDLTILNRAIQRDSETGVVELDSGPILNFFDENSEFEFVQIESDSAIAESIVSETLIDAAERSSLAISEQLVRWRAQIPSHSPPFAKVSNGHLSVNFESSTLHERVLRQETNFDLFSTFTEKNLNSSDEQIAKMMTDSLLVQLTTHESKSRLTRDSNDTSSRLEALATFISHESTISLESISNSATPSTVDTHRLELVQKIQAAIQGNLLQPVVDANGYLVVAKLRDWGEFKVRVNRKSTGDIKVSLLMNSQSAFEAVEAQSQSLRDSLVNLDLNVGEIEVLLDDLDPQGRHRAHQDLSMRFQDESQIVTPSTTVQKEDFASALDFKA